MRFTGGWNVELVNQEVMADYDPDLLLPSKTTRQTLRRGVIVSVQVRVSGPNYPEQTAVLDVEIVDSMTDGSRTRYQGRLLTPLGEPFPAEHMTRGDAITFHDDHVRQVHSINPSFLDPAHAAHASLTEPTPRQPRVSGGELKILVRKLVDDVALEAYERTWYEFSLHGYGVIAYLPEDGPLNREAVADLLQAALRLRPPK